LSNCCSVIDFERRGLWCFVVIRFRGRRIIADLDGENRDPGVVRKIRERRWLCDSLQAILSHES
jgi:hypothetical protein